MSYMSICDKVIDIPANTNIEIYVMEKPNVNKLKDKTSYEIVMTNLEEKSPIIIKKLLSNDLETRKSGLKLLQEETQNEWIPEYREYLWKTISQEKSKEFQLKLIKFAYNKMKETSL